MTHRVNDKRRVNADGTLREEAESQAKAEERVGGPEHEHEHEEPAPNVYALLGFVTTMLGETAWQMMGIRLAPGQKELIKDLPQAKLAIDTIVYISERLQPHITEEERAFLRGMVSDLQMNYVRVSQG